MAHDNKKKRKIKGGRMENNNQEQKNREQSESEKEIKEQDNAEHSSKTANKANDRTGNIRGEALIDSEVRDHGADLKKNQSAAGVKDTVEEEFLSESQTAEVERLKAEIDKLNKEVTLNKDKWLRAEADFDNFRKRVHKEKLDSLKYGYEALIKELLPIIDNLDRALEYAKKNAQPDSLYEGIELTSKLLKKVLAGFNVTSIQTVGQIFDPNFHEGIGIEEGGDYEDNVIVKEVEKGYLYKDRLLRSAKVIVGRKISKQDTEQSRDQNNSDNPDNG